MKYKNYYITFSRKTAWKWHNLGAKVQMYTMNPVTKKMGWYFLVSEIAEYDPEYHAFVTRPNKNRQKTKQNKKVKPRKPRIPNDKLHRDSVDKKWKRIAKESIPISP